MAIRLNRGHPQLKGCVAFLDPNNRDYINNVRAILFGVNSSIAAGGPPQSRGQNLRVTGSASGGYFPVGQQFYDQMESTTAFTVSVWAKMDSMATWGHVVALPWIEDAWSNPFTTLEFQKNTSTTGGRIVFTIGGVGNASASSNGFWLIDSTWHLYTVVRNGTSVDFYQDAAYFSAGDAVGGGAIDFDGRYNDIHLLNKSHLDPGEDVLGDVSVAWIYNRALSLPEIKANYENPWAPFERQIFIPIGAAAPAGESHIANVPLGTLGLTGQTFQAVVSDHHKIEIPLGALGFTGQVPTTDTTEHHKIVVPLSTLGLTGQVPTVLTSGNRWVDIPVGSLGLTGQVPTVLVAEDETVVVPLGTLGFTGQVPTVDTPDNRFINAPLGSLGFTGQIPTVNTTEHHKIEIPLGALGFTGQIPTVETPDNRFINVPLGLLGLTGQIPTVETPDNRSVNVPLGTLGFTGQVLTVEVPENKYINLPLGILGLTGQTLTVDTEEEAIAELPLSTLIFMGKTLRVFTSTGGASSPSGPLQDPLSPPITDTGEGYE